MSGSYLNKVCTQQYTNIHLLEINTLNNYKVWINRAQKNVDFVVGLAG